MQSKNSLVTLPHSSHAKETALVCSDNGRLLLDMTKMLLFLYKVKQ